MGTNPKKTATGNAIGKFARTLLASTCLTAASGGAALASTIYTLPSGGQDPNTFPSIGGPLTVLQADQANPGTTIVNVTPTPLSTGPNFGVTEFELTGLGAGTFIFDATAVNGGDVFNIFGDANFSIPVEPLGGFADSTTPLHYSPILIPASGDLFIRTSEHFESANAYTVTVQTQAAPEPSTIAAAGLGLATLLSLRRKKR